MPEKVTEFATGNISIYLQKYDPTRDELQQEYRYYLAHRMIKRLYMSEAITQEEYTDLELTFDYCHELLVITHDNLTNMKNSDNHAD